MIHFRLIIDLETLFPFHPILADHVHCGPGTKAGTTCLTGVSRATGLLEIFLSLPC